MQGPNTIKSIDNGNIKVFLSQPLGSGVTSQVYRGKYRTKNLL